MIEHNPAITRLAPFQCPYCGHTMSAAGTTDGLPGAPEEGCPSCCIACGGPMVFHKDPLTGALALHRMTRAEADQLSDDQKQELARVQFFARHVYHAHERARRN